MRYCNGQPDRRSHFERRDARDQPGELLVERLLQLGPHELALLEAFGHHDRLGEEVVRQLHVERQVEAHRALADIEAPMVDVRIALEQCLEAFDLGLGVMIEAFCGRFRSTSSSGRSEAGKNCCWTERMP